VTVTADQGSGTPGTHAGYFVAPNGTSGADGSQAHPWDFASALSGANGKIQPGDTVWIRGGQYTGVYRSSASGANGNPVVFRQYPNERATLDGRLALWGHDVVVWGFEIMRSSQGTTEYPNLESRGPRQKLINMVVHESEHQGIRFWDEAVDAEMYGCIVYNNGRTRTSTTHIRPQRQRHEADLGQRVLQQPGVRHSRLRLAGEGAQRNVHVIATSRSTTARSREPIRQGQHSDRRRGPGSGSPGDRQPAVLLGH